MWDSPAGQTVSITVNYTVKDWQNKQTKRRRAVGEGGDEGANSQLCHHVGCRVVLRLFKTQNKRRVRSDDCNLGYINTGHPVYGSPPEQMYPADCNLLSSLTLAPPSTGLDRICSLGWMTLVASALASALTSREDLLPRGIHQHASIFCITNSISSEIPEAG